MDELPPGFRFYPTEEELVSFYLHNKLEGVREEEFHKVIPVVDIYQFDPWQLPQISGDLCYGDPEQWFFFTPQQDREARGGRPNRITNSGYWKATGSPAYVYSNDRVIGAKKTMVFYQGKAPTGNKTKWKMIEYKAIEGEATSLNTSTPVLRHGYSVCRIYVNSGTVRTFDRRPSGPTVTETLGNVHASTSQQSFMNTTDKASSSDIASQENHAHPSLPGDADDLEMPDTIWPWEQLNWL
ncbi:Nac domain-containing protein [Thalictrum thalictroides]|uniref:Nac domain-containing protein n=1 Tax=Thalictrum thalictroides TaxID=46969 RepID=A0A7J6WMR5_THATH|nr:Nac domain-containing protein [Thalictrum thalictroides]